MTVANDEQKATPRQWLAVVGGIFGAFMALLDVTITNASIREIQGSLSMTLDEAAWISSAYLIAEIVVIPMSAWLASVFSVRRYLLFNCVLFIISSVACGLSHTLPQLIVARALQGFTGGVFVPIGSSLVATLLPPKQRPLGLALYSLSNTFAPAIGPLVGGWITVRFAWSFAFYLQLIPGLVLMALIYFGLDAKPLQLKLLRKGDWLGIAGATVGLACLTYVLEEGNRLDWYADRSIQVCTVAGMVAMIGFIVRQLSIPEPFINLRLLRRPSLLFACAIGACTGLYVFGVNYILPRYFIQIHNFDAFQTGSVMFWFGVIQLFIIPFVPYLVRTFDPRALIMVGFTMWIVAAYTGTRLTNATGPDDFIWIQIFRGIGQSFVMTPLAAMAFYGMEKENVGSAASLFSVSRQFAASIGICVVGLLAENRYQVHFKNIASTVTLTSPAVGERLDRVAATYAARGFDGQSQALQTLRGQINREAYVLAYADCYVFLTLLAALALIAVALAYVRKKTARGEPLAAPRRFSASAPGGPGRSLTKIRESSPAAKAPGA